MPLRLEVVGRAHVVAGGRTISPGAQLVFAAVLYLGLESPGKPVPRTVLAELLWPTSSPSERASRLRWLLSKLRRVGVRVESNDTEVRLVTPHLSTDFASVTTLQPDDVGLVLAGYAPSFSRAFAEWVDAQRSRIGRDIIAQLSAAATDAARDHEWKRVIALAAAIQRIDPANEFAVIESANAHFQLGDAARALACLEQHIADSAGPEHATAARRMADRIRKTGRGTATASRDAKFVGRTAQLQRVEDLLRGASSRSGGALLLTGVAGIGKTRMLDEAAQRALFLGLQVVRVRYQSGDSSGPLSGLTEVAAQLMTLRGAAGAHPTSLDRLGALVSSVEQRPRDESPAVTRRELRKALLDLLDAVCEEGPIAIILDDVQWADQASIEFLDSLLPDATSARVAWLLASRTDVAGPAPTNAPALAISSLSPQEGLALLDDLASQIGLVLDRTTATTILERSGGTPLFLRDLFRLWAVTRSTGKLPASLSGLFETTLQRLTPHALLCLQASALLGKYATIDRIERLLQIPRPAFFAAATELDHSGILTTDVDGTLTGHVLWAEASLGLLASIPRRAMHRHAAELFEVELQHSPTAAWIWEIVRHWEAAGYADRARSSAQRGADHLARNGLLVEAASVYGALLQYTLPPHEQLPLMRRRIDWLFRSNRLSEVITEIDRHEAVASVRPTYDRHNDLELLRRAAVYSVGVWPFATSIADTIVSDAEQMMADALACAEADDVTTGHRLAAAKLAALMAESISTATVRRAWEVARSLVPGSIGERRDHLRTRIAFETGVGDVSTAVQIAEEALQLEIERPPSRDLVVAMVHVAKGYRLVGRRADWGRLIQDAIDVARQNGLVESLSFAHDERVGVLIDSESPAVVRQVLDEVRHVVAETDPDAQSVIRRVSLPSFEAQLALMTGMPDVALQHAIPVDLCIRCLPRRLRARLCAIHLGARMALSRDDEVEALSDALASCFLEPDRWLDWPASIYARWLHSTHDPEHAAAFLARYVREIRRELYPPPAFLLMK